MPSDGAATDSELEKYLASLEAPAAAASERAKSQAESRLHVEPGAPSLAVALGGQCIRQAASLLQVLVRGIAEDASLLLFLLAPGQEGSEPNCFPDSAAAERRIGYLLVLVIAPWDSLFARVVVFLIALPIGAAVVFYWLRWWLSSLAVQLAGHGHDCLKLLQRLQADSLGKGVPEMLPPMNADESCWEAFQERRRDCQVKEIKARLWRQLMACRELDAADDVVTVEHVRRGLSQLQQYLATVFQPATQPQSSQLISSQAMLHGLRLAVRLTGLVREFAATARLLHGLGRHKVRASGLLATAQARCDQASLRCFQLSQQLWQEDDGAAQTGLVRQLVDDEIVLWTSLRSRIADPASPATAATATATGEAAVSLCGGEERLSSHVKREPPRHDTEEFATPDPAGPQPPDSRSAQALSVDTVFTSHTLPPSWRAAVAAAGPQPADQPPPPSSFLLSELATHSLYRQRKQRAAVVRSMNPHGECRTLPAEEGEPESDLSPDQTVGKGGEEVERSRTFLGRLPSVADEELRARLGQQAKGAMLGDDDSDSDSDSDKPA